MTRREPGRLPESTEHVQAFDAVLRRESSRVLEGWHRFRDFCRDNGIDSLEGVGLPLRPFFLKREPLKRIARDLYTLVERLRTRIAGCLDDVEALAAITALPAQCLAAIDRKATFTSPHSLAVMRPDGFYDEHGFHLSELNVGNGTLISAAYCEALHHFYSFCSPAFTDLGLDQNAMGRPLLGLHRLFCDLGKSATPHVAMLMSTMDLLTKEHWGLRAPQQLSWAPKRFESLGMTQASVHEGDVLASQGEAAHDAHGRPFDVVFNVTTGFGFFDEPDRLRGDLARFNGSHVGTTPFAVPLGALAFEKGILAHAAADAAGLSFDLPRTRYPTEDEAVSLRMERERYVIKRGYGDKHTFVGCSTDGRPWNAMVDHALGTREYIVQDYVPLSRTTLPVLLDDTITWLEVRVEVSPFITAGQHAGTMVRYAPDDEGLILSPPPEQMGFGLAYEV